MAEEKILNMHPGIDVPGADLAVLSLDFGKPFTPQVKGYIEQHMGTLASVRKLGPVGQSVGAILLLPAMEMINGLPEVVLFQPGKREILGWLSAGDYRHQVVRPRRYELPPGKAFDGYTVIDGLGKFTDVQRAEICSFGIGNSEVRILDVTMGQVDSADPTKGMVEKILSSGLTFEDTSAPERLLYLPPGAGFVAIWQAVTLYGFCEAWLQTIRLNKGADEQFHVAEVVKPQEMRQYGVQITNAYRAGHTPVSVPRELFGRVLAALVAAGEGDLVAELNEL